MRITRKINYVNKQYSMEGVTLSDVSKQTYLGVGLTSDLSWSPHIQKVTGKANRNLHFIKRNLYKASTEMKSAAYTTLIRPTLEYAQTVWDPYEIGNIKKIYLCTEDSGAFCGGRLPARFERYQHILQGCK